MPSHPSGASILVDDLAVEHGSNLLFENLTFPIHTGWTGIVGVNGAGKSTLLEVLAGVRAPHHGKVRYLRPLPRVAYVPQRPETFPDLGPLESIPWYKGYFELDEAVLERWADASPGERRRWQLASILASEPDLLLLDEPTHHLDARTRSLFIEGLQSFSGVGVLVSHDRVLLDTLCGSTLRLHGGQGQLWPGGWTEARQSWEQQERTTRQQIELLQEQRRSLKVAIDGATRRKDGAEAQKSAKRRMRNPNDNDNRACPAKNLADWAAAGAGRERGRLLQRLETLERERSALEYPPHAAEPLFFQGAPASRSWLADLRTPEVCAPNGTVILNDVDLRVHREARIWVSGDNGSGKTTLVRALVDTIRTSEVFGRLLWFSQEPPSAGQAAQQLAELSSLPKEQRDAAFRVLATLGAQIGSLRHSSAPSPGEARKIELAVGLAKSPWWIVLDEPQNHLDLPTLERLEAALREFPGAVLTISHDPGFLRGFWTERWRVGEGRVVRE